MAKRQSPEKASEAAKEAHSSDPEARKKAMATLREKRGQSTTAKSTASKTKDKQD